MVSLRKQDAQGKMKSSHSWLYRQIAASLVLLLGMPGSQAVAQNPQQPAQGQSSTTGQAPAHGTVPAASADATSPENALPENPVPATSPQQQPAPAQSAQPANAQSQQPTDQKPVGTAAAPFERTLGVAASRPAGAAIAPAKQRRVRTILISVGVVVAAGVAVGTVVGLSKASPSRP
jgi:hypothetical protein